jgi:hypothetical protein
MMGSELLAILIGWGAVIAIPNLVAFIIWTVSAKRKQIGSARPSQSSRRMNFPSNRAGMDRCLISFRLRPGKPGKGFSQDESRLKSGDRVPIYKLIGWRMTKNLHRMVFAKTSCRILAMREVGVEDEASSGEKRTGGHVHGESALF